MIVFCDSAPLIYLVEDVASRGGLVAVQVQKWIDGGVDLASSCMTLMELLVQPKRNGDWRLENQYRLYLERILALPPLVLDERVAELAAGIRADHGFKTPDAFQLAAAMSVGADIFYTNDKQLQRFTDLEVMLVGD